MFEVLKRLVCIFLCIFHLYVYLRLFYKWRLVFFRLVCVVFEQFMYFSDGFLSISEPCVHVFQTGL